MKVMSLNWTEDVQELLEDLRSNNRAAVNIYACDGGALTAFGTELAGVMQDASITMDVSAYSTFEDLARDLILRLLLRHDKPEGCRVTEDAIDELDIRLLRRHISRLLNAFSAQKSRICLILENFDAAEHYWDDSACAWVRELVDSGKIPICVILSSKPMSQVSEKPEGSSPLYNIFRSYPLEEGA
jgi:hypothetical protein